MSHDEWIFTCESSVNNMFALVIRYKKLGLLD